MCSNSICVGNVIIWGGVSLHEEDQKGIHINDNINLTPSSESEEQGAVGAEKRLNGTGAYIKTAFLPISLPNEHRLCLVWQTICASSNHIARF